MALRTTRLYYDTGLGVGDVLYDNSILNSANYTDFESHWDFQELFLTSLKLKATWDQVANADYLRYGSAYYWITGISMINENNAELFLQLDPITTLHGMNNIHFIDGEGIIKRAHPLADGDFDNLLPEPIGPQLPLNCETTEAGPSAAGDGWTILVSTLALNTPIKITVQDGQRIVEPLHGTATTYTTLAGEAGSIIVPNNPQNARGCKIGDVNIRGIDYYIMDNGEGDTAYICDQIAYLRSLGQEQAITGCYILPSYYVGVGNINFYASSKRIKTIKQGKYNDITANTWKKYTTHWNKTETLGNVYVVSSLLSGDTKTYKAQDICNGLAAPIFKLAADLNINGKPYIWPKWFDNKDLSNLFGANGVSGLEWLNVPIVTNGASGSLWIKNDYVRNTAELANTVTEWGINKTSQIAKQSIGLGLSTGDEFQESRPNSMNALGNSSGLITTALTSATQAKRFQYAAEKLDTDFAQATDFAVPSVSGNPIQGLQTSVPNKFIIYHYSMSYQDVLRIDKFFDNYGYAQNCVFDKRYIDQNPNGQGFCYLQATGVKIDKTQGPIAIRNLAEQQINNGVRIWRRLPS